ncbi:hypothetical protein CPAR01_00112 [Colletotrichum paranaense]|uniref:Uncharacterized protein n=1 Tax=Colletotrichum paranaense TaxID=1914294 RepID=A0ABQ9T2Y7_9PEZI|nr:uncharacterized protein CPAR01_00112 [Colletotrichum paranaense]KAK1546145.1 hypothetical protein CPAR01_00112 [Colletotrichum paranaense]
MPWHQLREWDGRCGVTHRSAHQGRPYYTKRGVQSVVCGVGKGVYEREGRVIEKRATESLMWSVPTFTSPCCTAVQQPKAAGLLAAPIKLPRSPSKGHPSEGLGADWVSMNTSHRELDRIPSSSSGAPARMASQVDGRTARAAERGRYCTTKGRIRIPNPAAGRGPPHFALSSRLLHSFPSSSTLRLSGHWRLWVLLP